MSEAHESSPINPELVITRTFNAPRVVVFKAWTDADSLAQWWGPKGFTMKVSKLELHPGGVFHYSQQFPDGQVMWGKFEYQEIDEPNKLVFTNSFSNEQAESIRAPFNENFPLEIQNIITFKEVADGQTELTMRGSPVNATAEERQFFASMLPMIQQGFNGTMSQLDQFLASL